MDIFEQWKRESHQIQERLKGIGTKTPEFDKTREDFGSVREYLKALSTFYFQYQDEKTYRFVCEQAAKAVIENYPECQDMAPWDKEMVADYYMDQGEYRSALHWLGGQLMTLPPSNYRSYNKIHLILRIAEIQYKHRRFWYDAEDLLIYALAEMHDMQDALYCHKIMISLLDLYYTMDKRCIANKLEKAEEIFEKYCSRDLSGIRRENDLQKFSDGMVWIQLAGQMKKAGIKGYREFAGQGMDLLREAFAEFGIVNEDYGYVKIADRSIWHVDALKKTLCELESVLEEVFVQ